jgi:hypothetical protein
MINTLKGFGFIAALIAVVVLVGYLGSLPSPASTPQPRERLSQVGAVKALRKICHPHGGLRSVSSSPGEMSAECRSGLVVKLGVSR